MQGKIEDFLVARVDPDNDDEDVVVLAWSDLATSIEHEGAEQAAVTRLAELGVEQSALREAMARKVVNEARIVAIREFREILANPGAAYAPVPRTEHEPTAQYVASPLVTSAPSPYPAYGSGPFCELDRDRSAGEIFRSQSQDGRQGRDIQAEERASMDRENTQAGGGRGASSGGGDGGATTGADTAR